MSIRITIPGELPSLNEVINTSRKHPMAGAALKRKTETAIAWDIAMQAKGTMTGPCFVVITWYEKDKRRDPDNIFSAAKFVLDALVTSGVLEGDSQKHIRGISHELKHDKENPRVVVDLFGVQE